MSTAHFPKAGRSHHGSHNLLLRKALDSNAESLHLFKYILTGIVHSCAPITLLISSQKEMCDIKKSSFQFYRIVFNLMALYCGYII